MVLFLLGCSVVSSLLSRQPAVPPAPLVGHVAVDDERITVFNDSAVEWTEVVATANGVLVCTIGAVHAHDKSGLNLSNCAGGPLDAAVSVVRVDAAQGALEARAAAPAVEEQAPPVEAVPAKAPAVAAKAEKPSAAPGSKPASDPPPAAPPDAAPAAAPATPSKGGAMDLFATMSGGFGPARRLAVFNNSAAPWTGCTVTANDLYTYYAGSIEAGGQKGILMLKVQGRRREPVHLQRGREPRVAAVRPGHHAGRGPRVALAGGAPRRSSAPQNVCGTKDPGPWPLCPWNLLPFHGSGRGQPKIVDGPGFALRARRLYDAAERYSL